MTSTHSGDARAGLLLYSVGVFFFAVNDALGKWLVADYSVVQIMAVRGLGAMAVLGPVLWFVRPHFEGSRQWPLQTLRVLCSAVDTFCFYFSTRSLPLADVMTFYLATPLIVVALSSAVLGESVGANRWAAVLAGFVGVVIAMHPSGAAFSVGAFVALFGSLMFAVTIIITRHLRGVPVLELVAFQVTGSGLVGAIASPFAWVTPIPRDLWLMALVGIVSMASFLGVTRALSIAPASLLAPAQYLSIVWAALLGWLVFNDVPGPAVVIGSLIIIASGLVVIGGEPSATAS